MFNKSYTWSSGIYRVEVCSYGYEDNYRSKCSIYEGSSILFESKGEHLRFLGPHKLEAKAVVEACFVAFQQLPKYIKAFSSMDFIRDNLMGGISYCDSRINEKPALKVNDNPVKSAIMNKKEDKVEIEKSVIVDEKGQFFLF